MKVCGWILGRNFYLVLRVHWTCCDHYTCSKVLAFFIHESVWMNFRTQLLSSALSALDLLRSWHMSIFEHVLWSQWVQCHRTLDRSLTLNFKITHNFTILIWQTVSSYLSLIHKPTIFSFTIHTLPCKICGKKIIK